MGKALRDRRAGPYYRNTSSSHHEAGWCNPLRFRSKQVIAVDSGAETGVRRFEAAASSRDAACHLPPVVDVLQ